jgi:hypothetical protein
LPADARRFYVAGAHFSRGTFGIFRADGRGALESADALDRTGLKLYAMIASQLRWLYYTLRGEFVKAAAHRLQLELHAAHVGSVWQVETWQAAALLLVYPQIGDIVGSTHLAHRLELLSRSVPPMKRYAGLARSGILLSRREPAHKASIARTIAEYETHVPRSYSGWATSRGYVARGHNLGGEHAEAKRVCEKALLHVTDADRQYVLHFLTLDLELAVADAALGQVDAAMERLNGLIRRYEEPGHPLALGLLHETRARIAWEAGKREAYDHSLHEAERWLLPSREPVLVAKCKRLGELAGGEALQEPAKPQNGQSPAASVAGAVSATHLEKTVVSGRARKPSAL